jgi:hypothetical protein
MAKFSKKRSKTGLFKESMIDKNFAGDDCDQFKDVKDFIAKKPTTLESKLGPLDKDIVEYIRRQSPEWETKIADMEKRATLKKLKESVLEDNKPEGDLLFAIFSKYKVEIEKIGMWGAVILGAILLLMMSSCFGGSNVEEAPVTTTTTTLPGQSMSTAMSGNALMFGGLIIVIGVFVIFPAILRMGGRYDI